MQHRFFQHYHPYTPLLDPAVLPDEYYAQSPLLFWTIILIASRRYTDEPGLFVSLAAPVKKMLWDTIANPPHTWHVVQSILHCLSLAISHLISLFRRHVNPGVYCSNDRRPNGSALSGINTGFLPKKETVECWRNSGSG